MTDKYDTLNILHQAHKEALPGMFHNVLWQVMINDSLGTEAGAFHRLLSNNDLVIALKSGGYIPTMCRFQEGMTEEEMEAVLEDLNRQVFGLTAEGAEQIVLRSYAESADNRKAAGGEG